MRTCCRSFSLLLLILLVGADQAPNAPKPTMATVFKTDGTSIRGTIVSADADQVSITPAPKPGQKEADPVSIPWKQIKNVSSGITQGKLLQEWKAQHHDDLCPTCHGDRTVMCPTCKGTAHDPAAGKDCPKCKGELLVDCKTPKCKDGVIPCPNPCLKLSEGKWEKHDDDGLHWRLLGTRGNGMWYSERHLGDLIVHDPKTGEWRDDGKCPLCGGKGEIADPVCHGTGKVPCPTCLARKDAPPCPDHCENGRVACPTCDATGLKKKT